jgi:hypothetical protein
MSESANSEISTAKWKNPAGQQVFFVLAKSPKDAKTILTKEEYGDFKLTRMEGEGGVAVPCTSTAPASPAGPAGTAPSGPSSITKGGGTNLDGLPVVLKTIGVLGRKNGPVDVTKKHIVVDPAGLPYIKGDLLPKDAKTLSEAIYTHYSYTDEKLTKTKIRDLLQFPDEVKKGITQEGHAFLFAYEEGAVIHVVGPNFDDYPTLSLEGAVARLSTAYYNVIREAETRYIAVNEDPKHNAHSVVRLPLISMGQFVGHFKEQKQELTARAVIAAFAKYKKEKEATKEAGPALEYWLCLWTNGEDETYNEYAKAFASEIAKLQQ